MTMIFLYALPMLSGFSNYLWPLLLGSRDMAFPRLNALSYWIYLAVGLFLYAELPDRPRRRTTAGSTTCPTPPRVQPGPQHRLLRARHDPARASRPPSARSTSSSPLLRTRAPGMSINRVPILIWGTLTASVANLLAVPAVSLAFFLLWMDRQFGTHFFDAAARRPAAAVAAPVLDVRPPLGLRHRAAGDGHGLGRPADLLPPAAGRLHAGGARHRGDHGPRLRRLGAPHVRHRPAGRGAVVLQRRLASSSPSRARSRCSPGSRTIWTGRPVFTHAVPVLRRLHRAVRHRRRVGLHDRARCRSTGSSPTPTSSSPTCTTC